MPTTSRSRLHAFALLFVLGGAIFLESADLSMLAVALPDIKADLGMSTGAIQWVVSAYVLGYGGFVLLGGRVGDIVGRRRQFLVALAVFIAFSVLGGLAPNGWVLVAARFVTGVAAGFMTPVGLSILNTTVPEGPKRTRALMVYAGLAAGGFSAGLVAGGLLTTADWRWTFFAPVVFALVLFATALRVIPRDTERAPASVDVRGALLLTATMLLAVFAVVQSPEVPALQTAIVAALAVTAGTGFLAAERRASVPIVRLGLLREGSVARSDLTVALWGAAFVAFQFVAVLYLQELRGWSPLTTALALLPLALDAVLAPLVTPWLLARIGRARTVVAGVLLGIAGYALAVPLGADSPYAAAILPTLVLIGLAFTLVYGPLTEAATDGVAAREQGLAGGVFYASFQFGAAVGLALVTAVVVAATGPDPMSGYRAGLVVPVVLAALALTAHASRPRRWARWTASARLRTSSLR